MKNEKDITHEIERLHTYGLKKKEIFEKLVEMGYEAQEVFETLQKTPSLYDRTEKSEESRGIIIAICVFVALCILGIGFGIYIHFIPFGDGIIISCVLAFGIYLLLKK